MKSFTTSRGNLVPAVIMQEVCRRLLADEDWQSIATEELRDCIPTHDDDLSEVNEVISEGETRVLDSR